jgi:hypothetical protein
MRFATTILLSGSNTGIVVPPEVVEALGGGKRAKVVVTLGGHTYRSSLASMGGQVLISLSADNRAKAGVAGGDAVDVEIALDDAPRTVEVPPELAEAFAADPAAKAAFDARSYSNQRRLAEPIAAAKAADTRSRRVGKVLAELGSSGPTD